MEAIIAGADPEERELFAFALRQAGFSVQYRSNLQSGAEAVLEAPGDLLLALRPGVEGLPEGIHSFRLASKAPLILLLEAAPVSLQLSCLRAGADLVLTDPSEPRLVAAYSLNLARRTSGVPGKALPTLNVGDLSLDPTSRSARVGESEPVRLTQLEFRLLYLLLSHPGQVIETEDLVERVWGYEEAGTQDLARGLVSRLRKKLGDPADTPTYIETIPSVGYRLRSQ